MYVCVYVCLCVCVCVCVCKYTIHGTWQRTVCVMIDWLFNISESSGPVVSAIELRPIKAGLKAGSYSQAHHIQRREELPVLPGDRGRSAQEKAQRPGAVISGQ